jgi:hypothetical protein
MTTSFLNVHKRENFVGYSPCDNNPTAAAVVKWSITMAVTTRGIKETKNNILQIHLSLQLW